jgi:hypothetical protein
VLFQYSADDDVFQKLLHLSFCLWFGVWVMVR